MILQNINSPSKSLAILTLILEMIQNPKNIIPEDSDPEWVRGGQSSRLIVKDLETSKHCVGK